MTADIRFGMLTLALLLVLRAAADTLPDSLHSATLGDFTVEASRLKASASSAAPLFELSRADIDRHAVADIADALHRLPGINLRDYGGAGGMKTVSVRGLGANHTGVVLDGVPMADSKSGRLDLSRFPLENMASLSLTIGDSQDIFLPARCAASAASLAIASSAPQAESRPFSLNASLKTGSWGLASAFIRSGLKISPSFHLGAAADFSRSDNNYPFTLHNGRLTSRLRRSHSALHEGHADVSATFTPKPGARLDAKLYFYDSSRQLPGAVTYYNPESYEHLRDRNAFAQASWLQSLPKGWKIRALAKFNFDDTRYTDARPIYSGGPHRENNIQREAYISAMALWAPSRLWSASYAADASLANLSSNLPDDRHPSRSALLQTIALKFSSSRVTATARALLALYDNHTRSGAAAKDIARLSPSAALTVRPFADALLFIRASCKDIYRLPTFTESYFAHMGDASLRPESTRQWNVGLTWQAPSSSWLPILTCSADAYANSVRDMIVAIPRNLFVWTMTNLGRARALGIDAALNAEFRPASRQSILLAANYSLQRVAPRTSPLDADYNKQVAYTPLHSGAASISWENPWICLNLHAAAASHKYGVNANLPDSRISGYADFGAAAWHVFSLRRISLEPRLEILNLFDRQYEIIARYPMPGRAWRFSLSCSL